MGLLQPESGLLFWMTLAFGAVFFLVAKFGFPVIVKAIDDRKHYIDSSLDAARKARQQLSEVETEKRMVRMEAEAERADILRTAAEERERMLTEAREQAAGERARLVAEARAAVPAEQEPALEDILAADQAARQAVLEVEQVEAGDALHAAAVVFVVLHHALVAEDAVGLDGGKCFGKQSPQFVDPVFTHVPRVACERHRSVGRGEDHPSARPQHTGDFTHERCVVVDVFDHLEGNDEIERFVPEAERRHAHPSEFDVGCVAVSGGGVFVHRDETVAMRRDEFDAVYLAIGAHSDKKLGLPGEEAPGVESAVKMLRAIGDDELPDLSGQRVCVIGGGNVAMDVARSAVRCGAEKVSIVYRRRICDMTAQDAEIAGAQAEGCEVLELTAPLAIETGEDGRVSGLRVQPQIIGEPRRGRPAPRAAATPERVIPCERVFVAIGQDIDSKPFEEMGIACKWGCIVTDSDGAVPNFNGLFSGGDCQTGPATVIRAINAGRVASANIDRYLGFDHKIKLDVELPTVQFKGKHECGRCELGEREAGERIHDWNLVEQGLTEEEARQEASRCLRCDHFGFGAFRGGRSLEW